MNRRAIRNAKIEDFCVGEQVYWTDYYGDVHEEVVISWKEYEACLLATTKCGSSRHARKANGVPLRTVKACKYFVVGHIGWTRAPSLRRTP